MRRLLHILFILITCWSFGQKTTIQCVSNPDTLYGQQVYDFTTIFPKFGDGQKDFVRYMQKNLTYKSDKDNPIYSISYTFIIDTGGAVKNVCLLNNRDNPNYYKLQAVLDSTLSRCPKWTPGQIRGEKVNTRLTTVVHIKFGY